MERKTITIEEIEANPNLDLTERINMFLKDKRWNEEDSKELAIASIKQEYEYFVNNVSSIPQIDEILKQILNGHVYTQDELTKIMTPKTENNEEIAKFKDLRKRIIDNNGITISDFYELCQIIGFDYNTTELIRNEFESNGLIIDSYKDKDSHYK